MSGNIPSNSGGLSAYKATIIDAVISPKLPPQPEPTAPPASILKPDSAPTILPAAPSTIDIKQVPPPIQPPPDPDPPTQTVKNFSSVGDPHDTDENGNHFDDEGTGSSVTGTETYLQSKSGDFMLQGRRDHVAGQSDGVLFNTAAGIKSGDNVISYDVRATGGPLSINGKTVDLANPATYPKGSTPITGGLKLADGTLVTKNGDQLNVTTPKGDSVNIQDTGSYINITGSTKRDMFGVLGDLGNEGLSPADRLAKYRTSPDQFLIGGTFTGSAINSTAQLEALDMLLGIGKNMVDKPTDGGHPDKGKPATASDAKPTAAHATTPR